MTRKPPAAFIRVHRVGRNFDGTGELAGGTSKILESWTPNSRADRDMADPGTGWIKAEAIAAVFELPGGRGAELLIDGRWVAVSQGADVLADRLDTALSWQRAAADG